MNNKQSKSPEINRRQFIQAIAVLSASWPITGITGLNNLGTSYDEYYKNLSDPWLTLSNVQEHLFPSGDSSGQASPGAYDIAALRFLRNMLDAPDTESEEKEFILNGVNWLNDLSSKNHKTKFIYLNSNNKENILRQIETSNAGSRWLSLMMNYLIEALLSDPVYGGNKDQQGWKWLEHIPGFPTPPIDKVYFKLGAHASPKRRTKS